jgi:D-3-phosphoglycerate dehydrogenase
LAKVLITTVPFGEKNRLPLELLDNANITYLINPFKKKLTEDQLTDMVTDYDAIIAGTETITEKVMHQASHLKIISRVGIGLDSVDLLAAQKRGIKVSYTPDAPALAVAELTIGLMLSLLRSVHLSNLQLHQGQWYRFLGRRLEAVTVGIIGVGRIGSLVLRKIQKFSLDETSICDRFRFNRSATCLPVTGNGAFGSCL